MMNKSMKDNKYFYYGYLLLIGVAFYVMNVFTPLFSDDWHFAFIFRTDTRIKTLGDVLYSEYLHYLNYTGRTVPHFFVQLFDGILGKSVFNVFNAVILVLFLHLLSSTFSDDKKSRYACLSIFAFFFFIVIRGFGDEFLWMSGACNYLWCATLLLLFHRLFLKEITSSYYYPLLLIFGLLSGWTNESLVLGMVVGYLVYIWDNKGKINRLQAFMLIGFFIGVCFLVLSPAAYQRFLYNQKTAFSLSTTLSAYSQAFLYLVNLRILPFILLLSIVLYSIKKAETVRIFKKNKYLIICLIITLLFIVFTKENSDRARFGIEFFALLLLVRLLVIIKIPQGLLHIVNVCVLLICFYSLLFMHENYQEYKKVINQIEEGKELVLTNEPEIPPFFRRFIVSYTSPEYDNEYSAFNKNSTYNILIARYFGAKSVTFFPERLYKEIKVNPDQYKDFSSYPDLPFYIKKYNGRRVRRVSIVLDKVDIEDLPIYKRVFVSNKSQFAASRMMVNEYAVVNIDNNSYLIVKKDKWFDENRVKEIIVE